MDVNQLEHGLAQFHGTEGYTRYMTLLLTDGMKYLAEQGECWWLMDVVASYQHQLVKEKIHFQLWQIKKNEDNSCKVTCREDTGEKPVVEQEIEYTDFPLDEYEFYVVVDGNGSVAMLKTEY